MSIGFSAATDTSAIASPAGSATSSTCGVPPIQCRRAPRTRVAYDGAMSTTLIIIIVVAVVILLALLFFLLRRRGAARQETKAAETTQQREQARERARQADIT